MAGRQAGLSDVTTPSCDHCPSELNNSLVTKVEPYPIPPLPLPIVTKVEPYKNRKIMQTVCVALQLFVAL